MDDSEQRHLNQQIKKEEAKSLKCNSVLEALANMLENDQPICACQLMSELCSLAEKEQAAECGKCEP